MLHSPNRAKAVGSGLFTAAGTGTLTGNMTGTLTGNMTGTFTGNLTGTLTATNTSMSAGFGTVVDTRSGLNGSMGMGQGSTVATYGGQPGLPKAGIWVGPIGGSGVGTGTSFGYGALSRIAPDSLSAAAPSSSREVTNTSEGVIGLGPAVVHGGQRQWQLQHGPNYGANYGQNGPQRMVSGLPGAPPSPLPTLFNSPPGATLGQIKMGLVDQATTTAAATASDGVAALLPVQLRPQGASVALPTHIVCVQVRMNQ